MKNKWRSNKGFITILVTVNNQLLILVLFQFFYNLISVLSIFMEEKRGIDTFFSIQHFLYKLATLENPIAVNLNTRIPISLMAALHDMQTV